MSSNRPSRAARRRSGLPLAALALALFSVAPGAQQPVPVAGAAPSIEVVPVRDNVFLLVGPGGNTTVQVGPQGVLVVDTMTEAAAGALVSTIERLAPGKPIRYVLNTHGHRDHSGGNKIVADAGSQLVAGNFAGQLGAAGAASGLVHASNFNADAKLATQRQVPILIVFTSPGCHYCDRVKQEYLVPMHKDPAYRKRAIIREVTVGATTPLTGFDGAATTEGAFAAAHKVFMVPTIKVLTPQGGDTGEAIVGMLTPDYYFGYLEAAIEEGLRTVRGK